MTQRKVNMAMVKNTPIRLVALDEEPPEDDVTQVQEVLLVEDTAPTPVEKANPVQDAAPVRSTPEHEAITRRVPAVAPAATPAIAPAAAPAPAWPKPKQTWRRFVPVLVALVPVVGLSTAWFVSRPTKAPAVETSAPAPSRAPASPPAAPALAPPAPVVAQAATAPEVIRLQISVEPVQAELGLDGNILAGHRLNLEVPKDRGIHVVSASAPGYFPFNQQVSFSNDIVLNINLRRAHGPAGRASARQHAEAKAQAVSRSVAAPPQVENKPQVNKPRPTAPRMEPGMDLDMPAPRHGAKSIDERNPYRP